MCQMAIGYLIWFACEYGLPHLSMQVKRILVLLAALLLISCEGSRPPAQQLNFIYRPGPCPEGWSPAGRDPQGLQWCYQVRPDMDVAGQPSP